MDLATQPQLQDWLSSHTDVIVKRWQELLAANWPEHEEMWSSERLQQLYAAFTQPNATSRAEMLELTVRAGRTFGLSFALSLPLMLRRAISLTLSEQPWDNGAAFSALAAIETLLDATISAISHAYHHDIEAEHEYLLEQQAQMATESDQMALQLSTLYDISQTLSTTLDRSLLLQNVGPRLLQTFDVQHCAIVLEDTVAIWRVEQAWGEGWGQLAGSTIAAEKLPKALLTACSTDQPQRLKKVPKSGTTWLFTDQPVLFVPLIQEPSLKGCLVVQSPHLLDHLDANTLKLWHTVANQIVVALQNAHLYSEVHELNTDLERKVAERTAELREERDRLEAIADIARDISTLEIDVLLNRILQALANLTGVLHGSVMLIDSGTGLLVDRAVLTESEHSLGSRRFQVGEGIVGWIAQHRQPALVNDVENDDRWVTLDAFGQIVGKNTGALVGVPLIAGDDVVGVLMLSHPQAHYFNQSHLRLLKAIAGEIAIAIYNAQLYEFLGERTNRLYTMLRHQEEVSSQNNAILQSLNDAVIVFNTERSVILANDAAARVLDRPLDDILTQTFDELLDSLNIKLPGDPLGHALSYNGGERPDPLSITITRETQWLQVTLVPVITERGEMLGACLIGRDITREVESDRLKTEFIGTVSHELRTPMTSIKGYTQLLAMGSLGEVNDTQKEFLNTITSNAERMIAIINDLLDITKIETGSVELNPAPLRMTEVLSQVVSGIRADLTSHEHDFSLNLAPNLPNLWADQERVYQVLNNLLSNAIKYTPRGGKIALSAKSIDYASIPERQREGLNRTRQYIEIQVQDSGVGIDPSEQDKIFERFYRTENQLKIEAGGTGLGLSLVKPLLQLMGGRIWVESALNQGSTFTVVLPGIVEKAAQ